MVFPQAKDNLAVQKGMCLLFASVFTFISVIKLLRPSNFLVAHEQAEGWHDAFSYYCTWGSVLLIGLAMLILFRWLHKRVHRVMANELGLQILAEPVRIIAWSEVDSVKKVLANLLSGFYLVRLAGGSTFYTPIEREPPQFATLMTWHEAPTGFEQLCKKHSVWVD